ncbi:MAG TPA: PIG-L family deacetylase [Terriglobales bacterium]|nr:PIG-L family deacetylase [Terriglobales bacterium]
MLILAAHPDDAALGVRGWLEEHGSPITLAYLTDGAPRDQRHRAPLATGEYPARTAYRLTRRQEAAAAWRSYPRARLLFGEAVDQELASRLQHSEAWLHSVAAQARPRLILAPAFEGGHPDHDAANLLAARLSRQLQIEAWEYALYSARRGAIVRQCFPEAPVWSATLPAPVAASKRAALDAFASQHATLASFSAHREALRPLPAHDYRHRPCPAPCVYELWGWPWSGDEIANLFAAFLDSCHEASVA